MIVRSECAPSSRRPGRAEPRGAALEALVTAIVDAWENDVFDERRDAYDDGWDAGASQYRE